MEPNKILSAPLIDLIFEGRNKIYGAYELRLTYPQRTKAALSVTIALVALALTLTTLANSGNKKATLYRITPDMELASIKDEKPPEKLPEPEKKPEAEPVKTQKFTQIVIVDKEDIVPPPAITDFDSSRISDQTREGKPNESIVAAPEGPGTDPTGIIQPKEKNEPEAPAEIVDIPAKFNGNWINFLKRNLNPEVPVNNGAPPGRYSVVIKFVVDKEGNVSETEALTHHGYGVEEEALRVLRKAAKWEPAIYNGYKVKAFHKQIIVFEVLEE